MKVMSIRLSLRSVNTLRSDIGRKSPRVDKIQSQTHPHWAYTPLTCFKMNRDLVKQVVEWISISTVLKHIWYSEQHLAKWKINILIKGKKFILWYEFCKTNSGSGTSVFRRNAVMNYTFSAGNKPEIRCISLDVEVLPLSYI